MPKSAERKMRRQGGVLRYRTMRRKGKLYTVAVTRKKGPRGGRTVAWRKKK